MSALGPPTTATAWGTSSPAQLVRRAAIPLPPIADPRFAASFDRFADARVVLLGEASHGTREFYQARAAITRHLVEPKAMSPPTTREPSFRAKCMRTCAGHSWSLVSSASSA